MTPPQTFLKFWIIKPRIWIFLVKHTPWTWTRSSLVFCSNQPVLVGYVIKFTLPNGCHIKCGQNLFKGDYWRPVTCELRNRDPRQTNSRAISPWPIGPQTLGPRTLSHRHPRSQGLKGRGPNIPQTSGPRPLGPSDLRCQGLMVRGPKVRGPMGQGLFCIVLHRFFIISCG